MLTKTITSHDVYNYGASLQAYSLQQFLIEHGIDNEIIDYKPIYSRARYNFWYISPRYKFSNCKLLWFPVCLFLAPKRFKTYPRKKKFDAFTNKYLKLSNNRYLTYESLETSNQQADAFIVGSDQVWNSDHINGRDCANYLSFVKNGGKKISYAASFGMNHINPGYENLVKSNLKTFDTITVREDDGVKLLKSLGLEGCQVVDPTLLHNKEWWSSKCIEVNEPDYLLVYDFGSSEVIKNAALRIAKEKNLKIYSINDFNEHKYADKNTNDAGPIEFISLIKNAKYFISNSFHGTIFSLIFHIPFIVVKRTQGNVNSRMESLLRIVGAEDRLIGDIAELANFKEINFEDADAKIAEKQSISIKKLMESLKKE